MKIIAFKLTMPNNNSWDGKWSGDGKLYVKCRTFSNQIGDEILSKQNYYYNFGDGWGANINVKEITSKEKKSLLKRSRGFYGYEWMIDSIVINGKIIA